MHRRAELGHPQSLGIGWQLARGVVKCLGLLRDGEVLVGPGPVGDPRVNTCHGERPVAK